MPPEICRSARARKHPCLWPPFPQTATAASSSTSAKNCPGKQRFGLGDFTFSGDFSCRVPARDARDHDFHKLDRCTSAACCLWSGRKTSTCILRLGNISAGPAGRAPAFPQGRRESRKDPRPAGLHRQKFRTHSILALEQFLSHRYVQVRIQGRDISGLECSAAEFRGQVAQEGTQREQFCIGHGAGNLRRHLPAFQDARKPDRVAKVVRDLAISVPLQGVGQVQPGKLPPKPAAV